MTVAFFVSPGAFPAIAADYVVTQHSWDGKTRFSSKIGQELAGRGLINVTKNLNRHNVQINKHARKTYIIDDSTCVSFSGNSKSGHAIIKEYMKSRDIFSNRPMREFGDIVDRMNLASFKGEEAYFVGASVKQFEDHFAIHDLATPEQHIHTIDKFGRCNFTGSGASDYIEKLYKTSSQFLDEEFGNDSISYFQFLHKSLNKICTDTVFEDFFDGDTSWDYGGFIEYCYYDPFVKRWQRQPDALYLFVELSGSLSSISANLAELAVAYRSESDRSGLLGMGPSITSLQTLYDITSENHVKEFELEDWNGWHPEVVNLHFYTRNSGKAESLLISNESSSLFQ